MTKKFNLTAALAAAEAGDASQWESIARHLIAKQAAPKRSRKAAVGPQTWAHVILQDGREYLTSAYAKADTGKTLAAHSETAQYRARMEDSGDNGQPVKRREFSGHQGITLDTATVAVPVKLVTLLETPEAIERTRDRCFEQRGKRQGWWAQYQRENADQSAA